MSAEAPWVAWAVDWDESEMFEPMPQHGMPDDATDGERLAWVCLVCDAKKKGRGGRLKLRKSVFQRDHKLSARAVDGMLKRAQKCGAVEIHEDSVTISNWRTYQDKAGGSKVKKTGIPRNHPLFPESALPPTTHHTTIPPSTTPLPPTNKNGAPAEPAGEPVTWAAVAAELSAEGLGIAEQAVAECRQRGNTSGGAMFVIQRWRDLEPRPNIALLGAVIRKLRPDGNVSWPTECKPRSTAKPAVTVADKTLERRQKLQQERAAAKASWEKAHPEATT
jgi:hypothetical protein